MQWVNFGERFGISILGEKSAQVVHGSFISRANAVRSAIVFSLHLVASVMAIPSAAGADQEGA